MATRLCPEMPPPRSSSEPERRPAAKTIDLVSFRLRRAIRETLAQPVSSARDRIAAA